VEDPRRFTSFASWKDRETVDTWRGTPEFAELLGKTRQLCEDFRPNDSTLAAVVTAE
jgi:quinol monooxygenase YgiN